MGSKWTGFTDEELAAISSGGDAAASSQQNVNDSVNKPVEKTSFQGARNKTKVRSMLKRPQGTDNEAAIQLTPDQRLSKPKAPVKGVTETPVTNAPDQRTESSEANSNSSNLTVDDYHANSNGEKSVQKTEDSTPVVMELDEAVAKQREMASLEALQQQQRQMEELNRQKKQLLKNAIEQRQKQAVQENSRLHHIRSQLQQLEQALSSDVKILRQKIEQATINYAQSQKRFNQAEAEYVAAKLHMQKTGEIKESLSEHLYTIIYQSELRKSAKLSQLAEQLGLSPEEPLPEAAPTVPSIPTPETPAGTDEPAVSADNVTNSPGIPLSPPPTPVSSSLTPSLGANPPATPNSTPPASGVAIKPCAVDESPSIGQKSDGQLSNSSETSGNNLEKQLRT